MPKTVKGSPSVSAGYAANMRGVAAVDRALSIAIALEAAKEPLTLSQLSAATGLYKSAVLRLMVSLERCGLAARRNDQSYVLGALAFRFGKAYESVSHLEETLLPLMHELVAQGMESPSFHVLQDQDTRLCLLRIDSNHSTLDRVRAGDVLPLKKGAAGKVLRWRQPSSPVDDPRSLVETSFGERDASCAAVACPVYGPGGDLLGALSLSGPLERFTAASVRKMSSALLKACEDATRMFGGTWPAAVDRPALRRRVG